MAQKEPLKYADSIEHPTANEQDAINGIIKAMSHQSQIVCDREKHAVRASHAKSTAVLVGTFEVHQGLSDELAQGLFARPAKYDVAIRFAQGPGEFLSDKVSTHRGMAMKILGVDGEKLSPEPEAKNHDFVFASGPVFPSGTAEGFLRDGKILETTTPAPEMLKSAVSSTARGINSALQAVGTESPLADFFGHPFSHPLSEPYYSQCPMRYGDYVAKLGAFPVDGPFLDSVKAQTVDATKDDDVFRTAMKSHFDHSGYTFELRVQLWRDESSQSIEDASLLWPETTSPFQTVATITIPSQPSYSPDRAKYFDNVIRFRPGRCLVEHRPLGSVMRARLQVYLALAAYRQGINNVQPEEPQTVDDIPK